MNLLQHIAQSRHLLRKSELKVADHVLLDPAAVMHSSMADLAHSVGISEPTIVRFCRAIGCSGFQDLKLKLAQSLAAGASFGQFAIHEDDSVADYSLKIFDTTLHTLMEVREKLDPVALQKAVTAMSQAQRVEFYGFGASGAVAADAQHKFFRLLLTAAAYSDPHMQAMSAVTLKPTDVAICISCLLYTSDAADDLLCVDLGVFVHVDGQVHRGKLRQRRLARAQGDQRGTAFAHQVRGDQQILGTPRLGNADRHVGGFQGDRRHGLHVRVGIGRCRQQQPEELVLRIGCHLSLIHI